MDDSINTPPDQNKNPPLSDSKSPSIQGDDFPDHIISSPLNLVVGIITVLAIITTSIYVLNARFNGNKTSSPSSQITPSISPSISQDTLSPTPSLEISTPAPSNTPIPTNTPLPTLTPTPTNTPTPTRTPSPTPSNTPTPTRIPNPPIMNISYPQEAAYIVFTSPSQQLCVVDLPVGGNTQGITRKHNDNDQGWTSYATVFTYCYVPREGSNRIQFQYKNQYGEESSVYTRQFNFHKTY